jgi:hypothetical protein
MKHIPEDINVEIIMNYYPEDTFKVVYKGLHGRNIYKDILSLERCDGYYVVLLGRNSLYNSLPEYIFHAIDRFDLPLYNQKERFEEEYSMQEKEKEDAYNFFAPIDLMLLKVRLKIRKKLETYTSENKILLDMLSDTLTQEQRKNKFIRQAIQYLPSCKYIRGDRTLITLMLRKILIEEGLFLEIQQSEKAFVDNNPRYNDYVDSELGNVFVGNTFSEETLCYNISFWSDEYCDDKFLDFIDEMEMFRQFIQDFFLSIDSLLSFNIQSDTSPIRLSDNTIYNYLNFNTYL